MKRFSTEYSNNKVFIHIPIRKTYLSDSGLFKIQSQQKGGTCWYYVLNYLRVRYGKNFPNQDYPGRKIERTLSSFRKRILEIENKTTELFRYLTFIQFEYQIEEVNKEIVQKYLNFYLTSGFLFKEVETLQHFLKQDEFNDFESFLNYCILLDYKNNATHCLEKLNINFNNALQNYIKEQPDLEFNNLSLSDEYVIFQNIIYLEAIKQYRLKISPWHPSNNIKQLIQHLTNQGPLAVSGYFKFKNDFLQSEKKKNEARPVYYLEEPDIEEEGNIGHAVLIIGAEIENDKEWIYYLDPNDSSETSKVYKIPYHYLSKIMADIYGNKYLKIEETLNMPFAVHADINWIEKEEENIKAEAILNSPSNR